MEEYTNGPVLTEQLLGEGKLGNGSDKVVCRVDGNDRLAEMKDRWDASALHNDGPHLIHRNVINQRLWTYIQSAEIRLVYGTPLRRVRSNKEILNLPLRCDSPTLPMITHVIGDACLAALGVDQEA